MLWCFGNYCFRIRIWVGNKKFFRNCPCKRCPGRSRGYIKREPDLSVIRGRISIQNGKDLFDFCNKNLQQLKSTGCKRRMFRYVESVPRNNVQNFKSIPDIRKIHCVWTTLNRSELIVSDLSCYTCDLALTFAPDLLKLSANFAQTTAAVQMIIHSTVAKLYQTS